MNIFGMNIPDVSNRTLNIGNFNPSATTKNTISIGGQLDIVTLGQPEIPGDPKIPGTKLIINTQPITTSKTIVLNSENGPGTSYGSGLWIYDNSASNAGYIVVSRDRKGYTFKSTGSDNKVKIQISDLSLNSVTMPNAGLLRLYATPQESAETMDSTYTVGVSSFDISNVTIRNLLKTTIDQQVIDTSMSVLGQMTVGKYQSIIANTQLDVSGNTIVSSLGIGVNAVNKQITNPNSFGTNKSDICLEISGNIYQNTGGYIWQF